jgi:hypothetical protein
MIVKETVDVPASTQQIVKHVTCDMCGEEFPQARPGYFYVEWGNIFDSVGSTGIMIEDFTEDGYEDGYQTRYYHVCPTCFRDRVEPWLQSEGLTPTIKE